MVRKISFGGIFSAITVLVIYFASIAPTGKIGLYVISSIPSAIVLFEFGVGAGIAVYFVSSMLSFVLAGFLGSFPYIFFFGAYSIIKYYIEKINNAVAEIALKLIVFNIALFLSYTLLSDTQGIKIGLIGSESSVYVVLAIAQVIFFVYDYVFSRLIYYYIDNLRNRIMKGQS